jgi:hypothetical protein
LICEENDGESEPVSVAAPVPDGLREMGAKLDRVVSECISRLNDAVDDNRQQDHARTLDDLDVWLRWAQDQVTSTAHDAEGDQHLRRLMMRLVQASATVAACIATEQTLHATLSREVGDVLDSVGSLKASLELIAQHSSKGRGGIDFLTGRDRAFPHRGHRIIT